MLGCKGFIGVWSSLAPYKRLSKPVLKIKSWNDEKHQESLHGSKEKRWHTCSSDRKAVAKWSVHWALGPRPGRSKCCVFGLNSLLAQFHPPPRSTYGYWLTIRKGWWNVVGGGGLGRGVTLHHKSISSDNNTHSHFILGKPGELRQGGTLGSSTDLLIIPRFPFWGIWQLEVEIGQFYIVEQLTKVFPISRLICLFKQHNYNK